MKWITRERVKVDRVACPWLIKNFVDKDAEFVFVAPDKVVDEENVSTLSLRRQKRQLGHHGQECSFEAILKKYKLTGNPALILLGKIVNGADTDKTLLPTARRTGTGSYRSRFSSSRLRGRSRTECRRVDCL